MPEYSFTLEELVDQLRTLLVEAALEPTNGQVNAIPDRRTVRYYTTLGLLDRPVIEGRKAFYGERHLLQALAVKRLQSDGVGLATIQRRLVGMTTEQLRTAAGRPDVVDAQSHTNAAGVGRILSPEEDVPQPTRGRSTSPATKAGTEPSLRRSTPFWAQTPENAGPPPTVTPDPEMLTAVAVGEGLTLLVPAIRSLGVDDVAALRRAAAPLLDHLHLSAAIAPKPKEQL